MRAAAAEERRHVARELHDVVAHAVSVMVIQAGAARQVVRTSPDQARDIAARRRGDRPRSDGGAAAVPGRPRRRRRGGRSRPAARDRRSSTRLVDRVREAGSAGDARGRRRATVRPAVLDVTVYRIVQEALTNALRYARRAATLVRLTWEPDQLRLEILDDGPAAARGRRRAVRGGLVGMRERAALRRRSVGGRVRGSAAGTRSGPGCRSTAASDAGGRGEP